MPDCTAIHTLPPRFAARVGFAGIVMLCGCYVALHGSNLPLRVLMACVALFSAFVIWVETGCYRPGSD